MIFKCRCQCCQKKDFWRKLYESKLDKLRAENRRLREALEWYANAGYERTLEDDLGYKWNPEEWIYSEPEILEDKGERARKALTKESDK